MTEEHLDTKLHSLELVHRGKIQRITFDQSFNIVVAETKEKLDLCDLAFAAIPSYQEFKIGTPLDERFRILGERGINSFNADYYLVEYIFASPLKMNPEIVFLKQKFKYPELRYDEACIVLYFIKK